MVRAYSKTKMKEFCLSEKICFKKGEEPYDRFFWKKDVKEFIKKLKEKLGNFGEYYTIRINFEIDELAGEKLK